MVALVLVVFGLMACGRPAQERESKPPTPTDHSDPVQMQVETPLPTVTAVGEAPPAPIVSPSPAFPGSYMGAPTPNPTPQGYERRTAVESYVVQRGQTLSAIALVFGCTVDEIVAANGLRDADSVSAGQTIVIPVSATQEGPTLKLVPDSEVVYGPAYIHFDTKRTVLAQGGYLADYTETVEAQLLSGAEIVQLVAERFSVGPRVLLTLIEMGSGWVTRPDTAVDTLAFPVGYAQDGYTGLYRQLSWAAVQLNNGYYGWKWASSTTMHLADGTRVAMAPGINPGTAGVQNCLAGVSGSWDEWVAAVGSSGFAAAYQRLFGNPFAYRVEPLIPADLTQPEMKLPWEAGRTWYLTSGPHGGWANDAAVAAIDFAPSEEHLGCQPSADWTTAAAAGLVVRAEEGQVVLDLDGDGFEQSGWVLLYLHIDSAGRVEAGATLQQGQRIGHPSCEGGYSEATHLHFARRYNGEWIPAGSGPWPMTLSGWVVQDGGAAYEGAMVRDSAVRTACECWDDQYNGLRSDNAP
ncbi:MAG: LysM peptidoglycan-binding domain-containing protein [Anaerolineales bacterium]|nr:LysM peptidoglycan-binding domain-containing protein [Anaerolineales bacterium]